MRRHPQAQSGGSVRDADRRRRCRQRGRSVAAAGVGGSGRRRSGVRVTSPGGVDIAGSAARRRPTYSSAVPFSSTDGDQLLPGAPGGSHSPSAGAGCQEAASACLAASSLGGALRGSPLLGDGAVFRVGSAGFFGGSGLGVPRRSSGCQSFLGRPRASGCARFGGALLGGALFGGRISGARSRRRGPLRGRTLLGARRRCSAAGALLGARGVLRRAARPPCQPLLRGRLGFGRPAMGTADRAVGDHSCSGAWGSAEHIDDRVLFGAKLGSARRCRSGCR